eukprot:3668272-Amphidinium_carterae.1
MEGRTGTTCTIASDCKAMKSVAAKPLADLAREYGRGFGSHSINSDVARKVLQAVTTAHLR